MSCEGFCNCTDFECEHHPRKHNWDCTPCIKKNLDEKEIPVCFWGRLKEDGGSDSDYNFRAFAKKVLEGH